MSEVCNVWIARLARLAPIKAANNHTFGKAKFIALAAVSSLRCRRRDPDLKDQENVFRRNCFPA